MSAGLRSQLETTFRDQYTIESELSGGGMARVFLATDRALGRRIVIKVLSAELTAGVSLKRFEREIRLAASLQQANIIPVLSAGDTDGVPLYTMPFVEGLSLRVRLTREGRPPLAETIGILRDIARALAYAHERGVVHRDIKPENVLLSGGAAVVTDFGIAKALANARIEDGAAVSKGKSTVTLAGTAVGTPGYMAPEQIAGDPGADHRADLYSFGCLAYELVAGKPPFGDRSVHALFSAHLSEPPEPVTEKNPECPPVLARLVMRCLEKDPAARPQSAQEILTTLDSVATAATPLERFWHRRTRPQRVAAAALLAIAILASGVAVWRSRVVHADPRIQALAVLPLENLSGDSTQDYFADGITEALITDFSRLGGLKRVIARASVVGYKRTTKSLKEIAETLHVDALVTSSFVTTGDRISVYAHLVNPTTGVELWSERYTRDRRDVLALQSEIVASILAKINGPLSHSEVTQVTAAPVNPEAYEAYDAYLKGRFHWFKLTPGDLRLAMQYFQVALEKDPNFALAHAGISLTYAAHAQTGIEPPREAYAKAKAAALTAIRLNDSLSEAHHALATVFLGYEWDWKAAEREFLRAIELNPNEPFAHTFYGQLLATVGRREEGLAQIDRALELDPHNVFFQWEKGLQLYWARRYDDAIAQFRQALELEPNNPDANIFLIAALEAKGSEGEALAVRKRRAASSGNQDIVELLERGYAQGGYRGAMRLRADLMAKRCGVRCAMTIAQLYALARDNTGAIEWLAKGYDQRQGQVPFIGVDPVWDSARTDPRFQAIVRKMNFPS